MHVPLADFCKRVYCNISASSSPIECFSKKSSYDLWSRNMLEIKHSISPQLQLNYFNVIRITVLQTLTYIEKAYSPLRPYQPIVSLLDNNYSVLHNEGERHPIQSLHWCHLRQPKYALPPPFGSRDLLRKIKLKWFRFNIHKKLVLYIIKLSFYGELEILPLQ